MTASAKKSSRTHVIGQDEVRMRLAESLRAGRAAHAYLFSGPSGIGKTAVALEFAQLLLCDSQESVPCGACDQCQHFRNLQHPDLKIYYPLPPRKSSSSDDEEREFADVISKLVSGLARDWYAATRPPNAKEIRLRLMRSMLRSAALKPYQAQRKVFLILHAETMNEESQNALLKVLEEPYAESYFLLVTDSEAQMRPTVRSRCQRVRMSPLSRQMITEALIEEGLSDTQAELASMLSGGSFVHARELSGPDIQKIQDNVLAFVRVAAKCDPLELQKAAAGLLNPESPTDTVGLEMLGMFLRDAAKLQSSASSASSERLTFGRLEENLRGIAAYFPHADFEAAVNAVDESTQYLGRGYTKEMVLYALAIRLNQAFGQRSKTKIAPVVTNHD